MKSILSALSMPLVGLILSASPCIADIPGNQTDKWIADLGSEIFQVRERASRELWRLGPKAKDALNQAIFSDDPEVVMRAQEILNKVDLRITESTPKHIIELIENYSEATTIQKLILLNSLMEQEAYFQILKLYSMEPENQKSELASAIENVALHAARQAVLADDPDQAIDLLRIAPLDPGNLMALACLYRSLGQMDQQLANPNPPQNLNPELWKGYLLRAKGDLAGALENAEKTNQTHLAAGFNILMGDPVPWLNRNKLPGYRAQQAYIDIALKRWRGEEIKESEFAPLVDMLGSKSRSQRTQAMNSLALLSKSEIIEKFQLKENPTMAYLYHLSREEIDKVMIAFGLDPNLPDFKNWVKLKVEQISSDDYDDILISQLSLLASLMERRGMDQELDDTYESALTEIYGLDDDIFWRLLSILMTVEYGAPNFALRYISKWAGEDEELWDQVFSSVLGEKQSVIDSLVWIREIDPNMKDPEALQVMLAIQKMNSNLGELRQTWMQRIWTFVENEKDKQVQSEHLLRFINLCILQKDVANALKAWDMMDDGQRASMQWGDIDVYLTAAGRWEEAAKILQQITKDREYSSPEIHAHLAATFRRGGMENEARFHDQMAEKLALGSVSSSIQIGEKYIYGGDFERAEMWFLRAVLEADPGNGEFLTALEKYAENNVRMRNWRIAAACHESIAVIYAGMKYNQNTSLSEISKIRMNADLARAMSILPENREHALRVLKAIHQNFLPDGVLADDFFPALREAGLHQELQAWFADSWKLIVGVIDKYPKSQNSLNTAAWFAARAGLKLEEAEKYIVEAIKMSPDQAAYLDTMAELKFAQGNRKAAIEWSQRSLCNAPSEDVIRLQNERFRYAPLPKN